MNVPGDTVAASVLKRVNAPKSPFSPMLNVSLKLANTRLDVAPPNRYQYGVIPK